MKSHNPKIHLLFFNFWMNCTGGFTSNSGVESSTVTFGNVFIRRNPWWMVHATYATLFVIVVMQICSPIYLRNLREAIDDKKWFSALLFQFSIPFAGLVLWETMEACFGSFGNALCTSESCTWLAKSLMYYYESPMVGVGDLYYGTISGLFVLYMMYKSKIIMWTPMTTLHSVGRFVIVILLFSQINNLVVYYYHISDCSNTFMPIGILAYILCGILMIMIMRWVDSKSCESYTFYNTLILYYSVMFIATSLMWNAMGTAFVIHLAWLFLIIVFSIFDATDIWF